MKKSLPVSFISQSQFHKYNYFSAPLTIGLFVASQFIGFYFYGLNYAKIKDERAEMKSARFAILPLLLAERDRA